MKHQHTAVNPDDTTDRVQPSHWNERHFWVAEAEPDDPDAGTAITWMSDGTGLGDAGDIVTKINVGGIVKYAIIVDFSEATNTDTGNLTFGTDPITFGTDPLGF